MLITESLYNLLYNLPSAPPEMGGLLGQSKTQLIPFLSIQEKYLLGNLASMFPMNCFWIKQYRTGTLKELFLKEYFTPIKRGTDVNACHLRILSIFDQLWMLMWKSCIFRLLFLILEFSLISQFMINYPDFLLRPKNWIWHFNTIKRRKTLWTKTI